MRKTGAWISVCELSMLVVPDHVSVAGPVPAASKVVVLIPEAALMLTCPVPVICKELAKVAPEKVEAPPVAPASILPMRVPVRPIIPVTACVPPAKDK